MVRHWDEQNLIMNLTLLSALIICLKLTWANLDSLDKPLLLSRRRRFLLPQQSGWVFNLNFALSIPLQDIGSALSVELPFNYNVDTGA